jgi:methyl-accepting chemotaxis protein
MAAWFRNLGLGWKILLAPAFLVLVLIGLGAYFLHTQRSTHAIIDAFIIGPVLQSEIIADFTTTIWVAQTHLYRLTASAANENDQKKIKSLSADTARMLATVVEKLKAIESIQTDDAVIIANREKLKDSVAQYIKHTRNVIEMADGEPGGALMFLVSAEHSFLQIEKLTDEMLEVSKDLRDRVIARANAMLDKQESFLIVIILGATVLGCLVSFLVSGGIVRPVVRIAEAIRQIAKGNFDVSVPATDQGDEIGVIAGAVGALRASSREAETLRQRQVNTKLQSENERKMMFDRLAAEFEQHVKSVVDGVSQTALVVGTNARQVAEIAEQTGIRTKTVSGAAQSAATNIRAVASASEEMLASIGEISRQVVTARDVSHDAVTYVEETDNTMRGLAESVERIGEVVKLISDVAEQTNLLALNATIEAARAGEAGRGFSVVASEVKALAVQTGRATEEIQTQITTIQGATKVAVRSTESIAAVVRNIFGISGAIASAVEEQDAVSRGIASNIHASSEAAVEVSSNIRELDGAVGATSKASMDMLTAAGLLDQQAHKLSTVAGQFLAGLSAA